MATTPRRLALPRLRRGGQHDAPLGRLLRPLPLHLGVPHRRQARGVQRGRLADRVPHRAAHGPPERDVTPNRSMRDSQIVPGAANMGEGEEGVCI